MNSENLKVWWSLQPPAYRQIAEGLTTGMMIGSIVPSIVNPLEKLTTQDQVGLTRINFFKAIRINPWKGTRVSIMNGIAKNILLFSLIPTLQQGTNILISNTNLSYLIATMSAAATTSYVLSPLQVIKARLYTQQEKKIKDVWNTMPKGSRWKLLFAGSFPTALKHSLYWPLFLIGANQTSEFLKSRGFSPYLSPLIAGYIGCVTASTLTYPLDVIAKRQKVTNISFPLWPIAVKMYREEGLSSFFRGLFKAHISRVFIAGMLTEALIEQTHQFFQALETS